MLDKNPIEARVLSQIESAEGDVIEYIIEQFPAELRDRLYLEVEHMEDAEAVTHLSTRLINRRFSLSVNVEKMLSSEGVEVVHGYPRAILQHIENSYASKEEIRLGSGNNGEVIASINQPGTCYKLLYLKRAQEMAATAAREALLQYQAYEALRNKVDVAKVPAVIRYVDNKDLRAIQMEQVQGVSLRNVIEGKSDLPDTFDLDYFFGCLENTIEQLNLVGIFHRDLLNNPGNVMVDKDGNPWIIDFGNAHKATNFDEVDNAYQLIPGGTWIVSRDMLAIKKLKQQVRSHLTQNN